MRPKKFVNVADDLSTDARRARLTFDRRVLAQPLRVATRAPAHRRPALTQGPLIARLGEQPEYLEIEPDQGNEQPERPVPLHVLGRALLDSGLDESKSSTRLRAAMTTTNALNRIPIVPLSWMKPIERPKNPITKLIM
jgi:hypothetical protein